MGSERSEFGSGIAGPRVVYTEPVPQFYRALRARADQWLATHGKQRTAARALFLKAALFATLAALCYGLVLFGEMPLPVRWAVAVLQGGAMFLFAMNIAHDASHMAVSSSPTVNRVVAYAYDLVGVSSYVTNTNHIRGHHLAPNVVGVDVAIGTDAYPVLRLHPALPHRWWHRWQHLYFPIAYGLATVHKWFILDYVELARNSYGMRRGRPGAGRQVAILLAFKVFTLAWTLGIPLVVLDLPVAYILIGFLSLHCIPGFFVALTFQLTHITETSEFVSRDERGRIANSHALHTLRTNSDVAPGSRLLNWLSGGLNVHVTHHLLPDVAHVHLPDLAPIVAETCAEFGVPYHSHGTVLGALRSHVRLLKRLGSPPDRRETS